MFITATFSFSYTFDSFFSYPIENNPFGFQIRENNSSFFSLETYSPVISPSTKTQSIEYYYSPFSTTTTLLSSPFSATKTFDEKVSSPVAITTTLSSRLAEETITSPVPKTVTLLTPQTSPNSKTQNIEDKFYTPLSSPSTKAPNTEENFYTPSPITENPPAAVSPLTTQNKETFDPEMNNERSPSTSSTDSASSLTKEALEKEVKASAKRKYTSLCFLSLVNRCHVISCGKAHDPRELIAIRVDRQYKTESCNLESPSEKCPFQDRCKYIHAADVFKKDGKVMTIETPHPDKKKGYIIYKKFIVI